METERFRRCGERKNAKNSPSSTHSKLVEQLVVSKKRRLRRPSWERFRWDVTKRRPCPSLSLYPQVPDFTLPSKTSGTGTAAAQRMRSGAAVGQCERSFKGSFRRAKAVVCGCVFGLLSPPAVTVDERCRISFPYLPLVFSYSRSGVPASGEA